MAFGSNNKRTLAVDLGADNIRAIELDNRRGELLLCTAASQDIATGTPDTLPERQLAALGELLKANKVKSRQVIAAMPTSLVVTRTVQLDPSKQPAEETIRKTLANCLPFDSNDLMFDYWQIAEAGSGRRGIDALVVATQASVVERYLTGFERLNLSCVHMDVAPCAIASLVKRSAENPEAVVGTISLSRNVGFFSIAEKGRVLFWRPFEFSGGGSSGKGVQIAGMQADLERVGDEISKCVSHMVGTMRVDNMAELLLFGNGSDDVVMTEYLKNRFHMPVRNPSPFSVLATGQDAMDNKAATHYATSMGLAVGFLTEANANG